MKKRIWLILGIALSFNNVDAGFFGFGSTSSNKVEFKPRKLLENLVTKKLKNGLEIIVIEDHKLPVVNHLVLYKVGSADEDPSQPRGLAHFMEHMLFRGTKNLPYNDDLLAFSGAMNKIGAEHNAATNYDRTIFFQTAHKMFLPVLMALEADRMMGCELKDEHIKIEKGVVLEERKSHVTNIPIMRLFEEMYACAFSNHEYRMPIIGYDVDIESYNKEILTNFYKKWYVPSNAIVLVIGDVEAPKVIELAEKYYGVLPEAPAPQRKRIPETKHDMVTKKVDIKNDKGESALVISYLVPGVKGDTRGWIICNLIFEILHDSRNNRLVSHLVDESKIASKIELDNSYMIDQSLLSVIGHTNPFIGLKDLESNINHELHELVKNGVTDEEVRNAKLKVGNRTNAMLDDSTSLIRQLATLFSVGVTTDQLQNYLFTIESITKEEINQTIKNIFGKGPYIKGTLSPYPSKK